DEHGIDDGLLLPRYVRRAPRRAEGKRPQRWIRKRQGSLVADVVVAEVEPVIRQRDLSYGPGLPVVGALRQEPLRDVRSFRRRQVVEHDTDLGRQVHLHQCTDRHPVGVERARVVALNAALLRGLSPGDPTLKQENPGDRGQNLHADPFRDTWMEWILESVHERKEKM